MTLTNGPVHSYSESHTFSQISPASQRRWRRIGCHGARLICSRIRTSALLPISTMAIHLGRPLLQATGQVADRDMQDQLLDDMEIGERGITIKARAVTLSFKHHDGEMYQLNLIDTPATLISPMKRSGPCRPAKARCCSSTRPKASKHKPWLTFWLWTKI